MNFLPFKEFLLLIPIAYSINYFSKEYSKQKEKIKLLELENRSLRAMLEK